MTGRGDMLGEAAPGRWSGRWRGRDIEARRLSAHMWRIGFLDDGCFVEVGRCRRLIDAENVLLGTHRDPYVWPVVKRDPEPSRWTDRQLALRAAAADAI